jgi:DNA uptake protein ComE-like DNA-binding protein
MRAGLPPPTPIEPIPPQPPPVVAPVNGKVDINTAAQPAFEQLPMVTAWHAEAAVRLRQSRGAL